MSLYIYRVSRKRTKRTRRKTNEFSTCFSYACYFNWRSRRSFLQINSQRKQRKNISTKNSQIIIVVISHNWFTSIKINEFSEKITLSRTNSASRDNWGERRAACRCEPVRTNPWPCLFVRAGTYSRARICVRVDDLSRDSERASYHPVEKAFALIAAMIEE